MAEGSHLFLKPREGLTPRQREILALIRDGYSIEEVGCRLYIAKPTVETHLANIFRRLEVRTRLAAVIKAIRSGYLGLGSDGLY